MVAMEIIKELVWFAVDVMVRYFVIVQSPWRVYSKEE